VGLVPPGIGADNLGSMAETSTGASHPTPPTSTPASTVDELVAVLPGVVWEADGTDYRMTYVSPAARDVLGHDPAEWLSSPSFWERHLHPDDRDAAIATVEAALRRPGSVTVGYRFQAADGTYRHVRDIIRVIDHDDGHRHLVGFMLDVSDEAASDEERRMLAAIVRSAADAAFVNDLDGRYLSWNDAAERLYGWSRDEVLGRTAYELLPGDEHRNVRAWIARVAAGETVGPVDATHRGRDGRTLTLSVVAAPVRDEQGRVTALATIARDVSAERRLATERRELEGRLAQAQKLEAVGRLAGGIAHDFNNLLTAIAGYAASVATGLEGGALAEQEQILRAAERATGLTTRLLAYARPGPRTPRAVAIDDVLRDGAGLLRRLVPERIELALDLGSRSRVMADPLDIDQAVMLLVIRAADAIDGAGRVAVSTRQVDEAGTPIVRLAVVGTGVGPDEATRAQPLPPPGALSTAADPDIGLATVDAIATRLGGRVDGTGAGPGTAIELRLPVVPAEPAPLAAAAVPVMGGRESVLIVDDAPMVGLLAANLLERAGYTVRIETSPHDALAHGVDGVDVVVSDVVMPGMSGPEMMSRFGRALPVVYVSGYTDEHMPPDLELGERAAFLGKPFSRDQLLATVRRVLDGRGDSRPAGIADPLPSSPS
jgi:hypothetical protein